MVRKQWTWEYKSLNTYGSVGKLAKLLSVDSLYLKRPGWIKTRREIRGTESRENFPIFFIIGRFWMISFFLWKQTSFCGLKKDKTQYFKPIYFILWKNNSLSKFSFLYNNSLRHFGSSRNFGGSKSPMLTTILFAKSFLKNATYNHHVI